MARKDEYYNRAKQEGYRSRAAYKLQQLDEREQILSMGDAVVDLGAAPGGWLQVAAEEVGASGTVVGVDLQDIEPLGAGTLTTIQGDMTDPETISSIRSALPGGTADVVLSDMAPEMTGEYSVDQARSLYLAQSAAEAAIELLSPGGHFVVKVFDGPDVETLRDRLEGTFEHVVATTPDASRKRSSERYLIGKRFVDAPVIVGESVTVTIEDRGDEGDGIARIDGYPIFIPDVDLEEEVTIEIEAVKGRYGFGSRIK